MGSLKEWFKNLFKDPEYVPPKNEYEMREILRDLLNFHYIFVTLRVPFKLGLLGFELALLFIKTRENFKIPDKTREEIRALLDAECDGKFLRIRYEYCIWGYYELFIEIVDSDRISGTCTWCIVV